MGGYIIGIFEQIGQIIDFFEQESRNYRDFSKFERVIRFEDQILYSEIEICLRLVWKSLLQVRSNISQSPLAWILSVICVRNTMLSKT